MFKKRKQARAIAEAEARAVNAELSTLRTWLDSALSLAESRQARIEVLEAELADAQTALQVALQACIDREQRLAVRS